MTKKLNRILIAMENSGDTPQHAVAACLTSIAENGHEQAHDAYLVVCAREIRDAAQSVIDHMTPNPKKAKRATVEPDAHAALLELAKLIVARWGKAVEHDEEIAGSDAVDSIGCYVDLAKDAIDLDRHYAPHAAAQTEFLTMLARMKTEDEYGEDGMSGDDAVETLSGLIRTARTLTTIGIHPMLHPPARPLTQRHQGDANHTALLDAQGNWIAILQLNGEMTTTQQDELLASLLRGYNHYETMHQALLTTRQHISQLSQTVNTLSERQGLGQNVQALDCHNEIDAALAHTQVREIPPMTYEHRVRTYEDEGMTTSDAQAVCDAEDLQLQRIQDAAPELLKALKKITDVALTSPQAVLSVIHDQKALIAKAEGRTF